eukprot:4151271-Prymnesium_polylepis.1
MASQLVGRRLFENVEPQRLDDLFETGAWSGEGLSFGHFDAEGSEMGVLQGGRRTILRDRPVFTVELHVHEDPNFTMKLLRYIAEDLDYDAFIIDELCGMKRDCRNLICIPRPSGISWNSSGLLALMSAAERSIESANTTSAQQKQLNSAVAPLRGKAIAVLRHDMAGTINTCCSRAMRKPPIGRDKHHTHSHIAALSLSKGPTTRNHHRDKPPQQPR